MNAIIKEWLLAAKLDLDSIPYLLKDESLTPVVAFHCQQAVEKSLKSVLELQRKKIPKIHKLQTLIDRLEIDLGVSDETIQILDDLYIESRYPGDFGLLPSGKPTLDEAKEFYGFAKGVYDKICKLVEKS